MKPRHDVTVHWRQMILLNDYTETLVKKAEETIVQVIAELGQKAGNSQLSNFQNLTRETDSQAVVENWVRYQMGRTGQHWDKTGLGKQVLACSQLFAEKAKAFATQVPTEQRENDIADFYGQMMRRYAGYLRRAFIAHKGFAQDEDQE